MTLHYYDSSYACTLCMYVATEKQINNPASSINKLYCNHIASTVVLTSCLARLAMHLKYILIQRISYTRQYQFQTVYWNTVLFAFFNL